LVSVRSDEADKNVADPNAIDGKVVREDPLGLVAGI